MPPKLLKVAPKKTFYMVFHKLRTLCFEMDANTTSLEAEIDRMVYDLYGLTEEERKIVEGE